ncbi:uncharacterized protein RSE6_15031 [Rhynchosporium secalis]|uniref:Uncharacterized protein n=1 Tax=Rhynchosporium secalis TaxID=38038 RepID=A0A1E1MWK4_RHYSE|nr:uncharacterized protein RSE6_15031 [Rhynchosporium secalis]
MPISIRQQSSILLVTRNSRTASLEVKIEGRSNSSSLTATNRSAELKSAKRAAILQYQEQWCDLKGIDPENMNLTAEGRFLKAWNEIKDTL